MTALRSLRKDRVVRDTGDKNVLADQRGAYNFMRYQLRVKEEILCWICDELAAAMGKLEELCRRKKNAGDALSAA